MAPAGSTPGTTAEARARHDPDSAKAGPRSLRSPALLPASCGAKFTQCGGEWCLCVYQLHRLANMSTGFDTVPLQVSRSQV